MPSKACPTFPNGRRSEKLKYEKEALDFYISSHPLAQHAGTIDRFASHNARPAQERPAANQEVFFGGMLTQVRYMNTKKARNGNTRYVRCKLEDFTGSVECVMWPDDYVRYKELIAEDAIVFVAGTVERNRDEPGLVLTRILTIEQGQRERTTGLVLLLHLQIHKPEQIDAVAQVLQTCPRHLARLSAHARSRRQMAQAQSQRRFPRQPSHPR